MLPMVRYYAVLAAFLITAVSTADDQPILLKDDPRLQTKVTLKLAREPLSLFAETLSKATGVTIRARKDVADKNVTVFAKDIPAYEAMNQVAKVLEYGWEFKGDSPKEYSYVIFRSLKKKTEAEDLRQAEQRKKDQQFKDGIENAMKMVDADTADWQKAFDKNPTQAVADYNCRSLFRELACFTRAQRDDIWARIAASPYGEVRIPFTELPPSLQKFWKDKATEVYAEAPEWYPSPDGLDQDYFVISRGGGYGQPRISGVPVRSGCHMGMAQYGFGLWAIMNKDARVSSYSLERLQAAGVDTSSYKAPGPDYVAAESKTKRVQIKFKERDKTKGRVSSSHVFAEILEAAAQMLDINVFADDYLCRFRNSWSFRTSFPEKMDEALDEIGREFQYEPASSGKTAGLRCKTWYIDEASEVPKRLVLRWAEAKKKQGRLELKDYVNIARELTNVQINGLQYARIEGDIPLLWEVLREIMCMGSHVDRLRLCSMLTADQMKKVSEGGLRYGDMDSAQQQAFAALLRDAKSDLPDEKLDDCAFGVRNETKNREGRNDETGEPMKYSEDVVVFTYTFAPGDEKSFEMYLQRKLPKTDKATSNQ